LSDDESPYLFSEIPVEILGSVYERFLGKVVVLKGRGISIDEKPEVRKAGGVYPAQVLAHQHRANFRYAFSVFEFASFVQFVSKSFCVLRVFRGSPHPVCGLC
jgi:hypothetical protein